MATKHEDTRKKINEYANANDTDVVAYFGDISRDEYESLAVEIAGRRLRRNVLLLMVTLGGDPNAAYRIARLFQEFYNTVSAKGNKGASSPEPRGTFSVYVDTVCKSAGTMVCLGADKLILSDKAELGPIDVQLRKEDEVGERRSGLMPIQAMQFLETESVRLFKRHFVALRDPANLGFSTRMAAGIATEMTVGLLTAIYQQLDPVRLAEVDRSLQISLDYGGRLAHDGNLKEGAIERLVAEYPSHGFVIDRKEVRELFARVEEPSSQLAEAMSYFRPIAAWAIEQNQNLVVFLCDEPSAPAPRAQPASVVPSQQRTSEAVA
jgi:hypothetical protein